MRNAIRLGNGAFLGLHAALWCALAVGAGYRAQTIRRAAALPALRETPLRVEPQYDYPVVVSDEQLERVLRKLAAPLQRVQGAGTRINHIDHALRLWTPDARWEADDDSQPQLRLLSGEALRELLTDHRRFVEILGEDQPPLLIDTPYGVRVRVQQGAASSSHVDHTLACLAEVGTPPDFPLISPGRRTTYRAMVEQALRDFSINQMEYEWSALTFALLLPPVRSWQTSEGQQVSFDRLAERMMRERLPRGVCFGNHRLHALVMLLRVDEQEPILSNETRAEIVQYLTEVTALLVAHQHFDGFWNEDWPHAAPASSTPTDREGDRLAERILATGHALEWWALAPRELHPPRPVLAAAGQWLVREIDALPDEDVVRLYTYLTHAGRALALWRSRSPADVIASSAGLGARTGRRLPPLERLPLREAAP